MMNRSSTPQPAMRRPGGRWRAVGLLILCVGLVGGGWAVGSRVRSPSQAAARAAAPVASLVTAPVELRTLSETVIVRGDVRPSVSLSIGVPGSVAGSPVVTGVFVKQGDVLSEGHKVIEVSGRPVFVLAGAVPVYRDLKPGMSGADVSQLQAGLGRLGCTADTDGVYAAATKACVAKLYADAGYSAVPASATEVADLATAAKTVIDAQSAVDTSTVALAKAGRGATSSAVLAAQDAVNAAQRALDDAVAQGKSDITKAQNDLNAALATRSGLNADPTASLADRQAATAAVAAASLALADAKRRAASSKTGATEALKLAEAQFADLHAAPDVSAETAAIQQAQAALAAAKQAQADLAASTGPTVPQGEIVFVPSFPARVDSVPPGIGPLAAASANGASPTAGSSGLLSVAAGALQTTARVNVNDKGLLRVGMTVDLLDELSNTTYPATLASLEDTASIGPDQTQGYGVSITSATPLPDGLSGANVRVTFTAATTSGEVLVVPLAAVSSGANGATRVDKVGGNGKSVPVPVTAGLSADGFVAVTPTDPAALVIGDLVVVGDRSAGTGSGSGTTTAAK